MLDDFSLEQQVAYKTLINSVKKAKINHAYLIESNGYPKAFDSHVYGDNIDKALMRATGEFANTWGAMCLREDRQLQMVMLMTADGFVIDKKVIGQIADLPDTTE